MFVSVDKKTSQIWPTQEIKIRFNGMDVTKNMKILAADDEAGVIYRLACDYKGNPHILVGKRDDPRIIECRWGKVEILHGD